MRRIAGIAIGCVAAVSVAAVAAGAAGAAGAGSRAGGAYAIRVAAPPPLAPGRRGAISFAIAPGPGRTISKDGPIAIRLSVSPAAGLDLPRRRYARADAADPRARAPRFDLAVKATSPGKYEVKILARFWVCARRSCRPITARRAVPVTVTAPPPADAGASAAADAGRRGTRSGSAPGSNPAPPRK